MKGFNLIYTATASLTGVCSDENFVYSCKQSGNKVVKTDINGNFIAEIAIDGVPNNIYHDGNYVYAIGNGFITRIKKSDNTTNKITISGNV